MKQVIHSCLFLTVLVISSFVLKQEEPKALKVRIDTPYGPIIGVLYNDTPLHRDNFAKNIKDSVYKDLLFHRVIKDFMIQGGDPNSRNAPAGQQLGMGGPGYTLPAEILPQFYHKKGALSAARTGDQMNPQRRSSGSQFYVVHGKKCSDEELKMMESKGVVFSEEQKQSYKNLGGAPFLDAQYTVFGEVVEGLEIIDKIATVATANGDRPVEDVKILKTTILK
jgi:peptidyl-prolyl cis-trans isomerase B (cyclophilin B)